MAATVGPVRAATGGGTRRRAVGEAVGATFASMTFPGWPAEAFDFYEGLEADNSKAYWQANKHRYERVGQGAVRGPLGELDQEFGPFRLFRPYRDVRFSKDKTPYKTAAAASSEGERGTGLYVQVSAAGLMVGSGYYHMASDQLARFREAVDDDARRRGHRHHLRDPREEGPRDRRVRAAQDRTARLRQGPPARRPAAAQGAGGHALLPRGGLAAHRQGEGAGRWHVARGAADARLARRPRRPERAAAA